MHHRLDSMSMQHSPRYERPPTVRGSRVAILPNSGRCLSAIVRTCPPDGLSRQGGSGGRVTWKVRCMPQSTLARPGRPVRSRCSLTQRRRLSVAIRSPSTPTTTQPRPRSRSRCPNPLPNIICPAPTPRQAKPAANVNPHCRRGGPVLVVATQQLSQLRQLTSSSTSTRLVVRAPARASEP